jgi:hypothetical protein
VAKGYGPGWAGPEEEREKRGFGPGRFSPKTSYSYFFFVLWDFLISVFQTLIQNKLGQVRKIELLG